MLDSDSERRRSASAKLARGKLSAVKEKFADLSEVGRSNAIDWGLPEVGERGNMPAFGISGGEKRAEEENVRVEAGPSLWFERKEAVRTGEMREEELVR